MIIWRDNRWSSVPLDFREQNTLDLVAWKCGSPNTLLADHSIGHQCSPISCNLPFLIAFLFLTCMPKRFVLWTLPSCGDWDNKRIRNLGYIMSPLNRDIYYSVLCRQYSIMHASVSHSILRTWNLNIHGSSTQLLLERQVSGIRWWWV